MSMTTELAQRMKAAALKASDGDWVKESGDGWEAICSANDQANGGFIIAHLEGPDAAENREFVQLANPANVLKLVEALEARDKQIAKDVQIKARLCRESNSLHDRLRDAEKRIAELEARTVKLPRRSVGEVMYMSGFSRDYAEGWCAGNDNAIHEIKQIGIAMEGE
ncbi:ead/Ea22-like family protein [Pseudocitrobacter faecalis]|uniref:ead/Ea22-like family protein n=1 Tax=Pseudocitrobacter faecalis TaxID=1398493 RepID=UPI003899CBA7